MTSNKLNEMILEANTIAIFSHTDPDADAIASSFATKIWIQENYFDKNVDVIFNGNIDETYNILTDNQIYFTKPNKTDYDLCIVLDCASLERTGNANFLSNAKIINIDHHEQTKELGGKFGKLNIVHPECSSTGEVLYLLFKNLFEIADIKLAELIYQSIITDTACFSCNTMSKRTHLIVEKLLQFGIDDVKIKNHYFNNISKSKFFLLKQALNSTKFVCNNKISIMQIKKEDFEQAGADFTDTLGIVENGIKIEGVDIAIIVIEKAKKEYYISLRSRRDVSVKEIAEKFGGGGGTSMAALQHNGEGIAVLLDCILVECKNKLKVIK